MKGLKGFILCDEEKILEAGAFNSPEEIIYKCEKEYGNGDIEKTKEYVIKYYKQITEKTVIQYYFEGGLHLYILNDIMLKRLKIN